MTATTLQSPAVAWQPPVLGTRHGLPAEVPVLLAGDLVAAGVATLLARPNPGFVAAALMASLLVEIIQCDLTRPRMTISGWREGGRAVRAALPGVAVASVASAFGHHQDAWVAFGVAFLVGAVLLRLIATWAVQILRRRGHLARPTVVIGDTDHHIAQEVASIVEAHPELGLRLVGRAGRWWRAGVPEVSAADLADDRARGTCVIVATHRPVDRQLVDLVHGGRGLEFFLTLRHLEASMVPSPVLDYLWTVPVGWVRAPSKRVLPSLLKRTTDLVALLVVAPVVLPVMAVLAVAVATTSPGGVLFRQRRIGRHGREFDCLKFRSMRVHDETTTQLSDVTRVGRLMRRTGLDELPQLFNVLRGDMSLVGPRPERTRYVRRYNRELPSYRRRHRLTVGLTGLAQVSGLRGDDTSIADRAAFDNRYIDRWSFFDDLSILLRTIATLFRRGEH
jgi:exopolysaccharide biosynthesis polyprenyl glycosylphosphotransferase